MSGLNPEAIKAELMLWRGTFGDSPQAAAAIALEQMAEIEQLKASLRDVAEQLDMLADPYTHGHATAANARTILNLIPEEHWRKREDPS